MYRIWCERELPSRALHLLDGVAIAVSRNGASPETELSSVAGAQAVIASSRIRYDGAFMDRFPTVRVVSRTGIGLDNVSISDATVRGVAVCNAPDAPTISTSEHTVALLLAAAKHLKRCDSELRRGGKRDYFTEYQGIELYGLELGLVGLGRIGKRVAKVALALGMRVRAHDPVVTAEQARELGVELAPSLEAVLRSADIVSLHIPLTDDTRNLLNTERLAMMKPGSYLVNAARGGLVDQAALLAALESGHLHGAGLDVFPNEPPDPKSPLLQRDDVIATPHIAGATQASKDRLWSSAITQALQVLRGERPPHLANPEVWPLMQPA
jgi:D-3-phosphoglycerate dehydrogenase / 2-oxoglutarate reductase